MITKKEFEDMVDWIQEGIVLYREANDLKLRVNPVEVIFILRRFLQVCKECLKEKEPQDLVIKAQFLLDSMNLEDKCFTFPDGETWHQTPKKSDPNANYEPLEDYIERKYRPGMSDAFYHAVKILEAMDPKLYPKCLGEPQDEEKD